ncbi:MAG: TraE/TraK family type IV conjugative transfer system protein [Aeromonas popoffii]|uniref:TraE/TraK family type IV conjugative transfer system protein n=1 Tax=Aeromonas popoffii TaxID=70856 RepID=UPI003F3D5F76
MADPIGNFFKALFNKEVPTRARDRAVDAPLSDVPTVEPEAESKWDPLSPALEGEDRKHTAITSWSSAMVKSNFMMLSNAGLVAIVLLLVFNQMNKKPTIIVKPPVMTGEFRIEDGLPNKEWQQSWALFIAHMLGNVNPRNVEFVARQVTSLLSPNLQAAVEVDLRKVVEMMRMSGLSQTFEVQDLRYDQNTGMVWCWGIKNTHLVGAKSSNNAGNETSDRRRWTYEFIIRLNEMGMPVVTHIDQYEGAPRYDRASGVTEEGQVLNPPKKNKGQHASKEPN